MDRVDAGIHGAEEGSRQHEALSQGSPLLCLLLIIFVVVVSPETVSISWKALNEICWCWMYRRYYGNTGSTFC